MKIIAISAMAMLIVASAAVTTGSVAQDAAPATVEAAGPSLTQPQLEQLVAPVALYDDPLLADVLTASTYPLEVVEARRWLADPANAALKGDALTSALDEQDWDPSVKALVPFPQVIEMMDSHLDWTENLGEAFLAQEDEVMDAVQRLRHRAESAGTLKSSPQQTVADDAGDVTISPPPEAIYVPQYDPWCAYGPWPYPVYAPLAFEPWPGYCVATDYTIGFGIGILLPFEFWDWGYFDWHHHHIGIHRSHYERFHSGHQSGDVWHHDPAHRVGVPYRNPRNVQQFQGGQRGSQAFRGYQNRDGGPAPVARPEPPAFGNFGSGQDIRIQSQRGQISRQGFPHGGGAIGMPHGGGIPHGGGMPHGGGHGGRP